jgi:ABC-type multidrug transport system fused ATPase/permease subunit
MKDKAEKKKLSWRETIRIAWKPYRRLYSYVLPYKWRFFFGLLLGCLFGATSGILPIVMGHVSGAIFYAKRHVAHSPLGVTERRRIG